GEHWRPLKLVLGTISTVLGVLIAVALLRWVNVNGPATYLVGNWPVPFGIALAVDRLSALMLVITWILGGAALLFGSSRWHRAGVHFPALFQLELMGLSGAFLTADIFNLFVFFEILLAASYGLLLHGSGESRVRASVRYVAVNILASSIFLIGVSTIYGVTGTLDMAELAARLSKPGVPSRHLVDAGAALLAIAFLIKAAAWPLNFWLVPAYRAATPPAAAIFAVLTKVGVYSLVRLWNLMFAGGPLAGFGADGLLVFGLGTAILAAFGMLASHRLAAQVAWGVVISAGTLVAALGTRAEMVLGGAIFYLLPSTVAAGAAFLLADLIDRWEAGTTIVEEAPFLNAKLEDTSDVNLDDEEAPLVGRPIPASAALLGFAFLACALLIAGFPPLPTFIGKAAMVSAAIAPATQGQGSGARGAIFATVILGCGLVALIALSRTGIRIFWSGGRRQPPVVRAAEAVPVVGLLALCGLLTVAAGPTMSLAHAAARSLRDRRDYIDAVLRANVSASPTTPKALRETPR
ncbi:MAG TPA: monovalent cation/H+ antiporter subunit D, partial [Polyangia bacterium]|nr:monovalent cation/H+ antiporter subunit D [Polyangia bacterium]